MKMERLLSILFYLLNRNSVSGSALAEEFGVSRRTIIRDIETLSLAGIPIYSEKGSQGGYAIHQDYQLNGKILTKANAQYLLLALNSLRSVYGELEVKDTYEKVAHLFANETDRELLEIDFSVVAENQDIIEAVSVIKQGIMTKKQVTFDYTSPSSGFSQVTLDPLHVMYQWYAWYVFGFSHKHQEIRQYKLARMRQLQLTETPWLKDYPVEQLLEEKATRRPSEQVMVQIRYPKAIQVLVEEYLPGTILSEDAELITAELPIREGNVMSFSILLGFANRLQILGPPSFVEKFRTHLADSLKLIEKSDS